MKNFIVQRFGQVPNELLNNADLSFKAKGLYAYIQSKSDSWQFSATNISRQTKESVNSINSGLKELEDSGYLLRKKYKNRYGHWGILYILAIHPFDFDYAQDYIENICNTTNPVPKNPVPQNPMLENPVLENHYNNSKKELSKKELSKKELLEELSTKKINNDFDEIKNYWNSHSNLPRVNKIAGARKQKLQARITEVSIESIFEAIKMLSESDFATGANDRGWKATLDWLIANDLNVIKVLEGKYNQNKKDAKMGQFRACKIKEQEELERAINEIL